MKRIALSVAGLIMAAPAQADLDFKQMETATGLAKILGYARVCGYSLDRSALERYFTSAGLATPEGFSYVSANMKHLFTEKPSEDECTLAKATAKEMGLVAE
ncbi:hypothetical protein RLPCCGM1_c2011 [Rhizobium leguminosarum bv. phaseoli CCGM1]|nr:hypothetical protein RLPCCGM1_c2011 [Rhizobium leguminosarum bv. phaseoli CCGM1]